MGVWFGDSHGSFSDLHDLSSGDWDFADGGDNGGDARME